MPRPRRRRWSQRYHAVEVDAVTDKVVGCLLGNPAADVLHFSLHGKYDPGSAKQGLVLVDGEVIDPLVVKGGSLAEAPLVFLNACQVGAGQETLGDYAGLAESFLFAGASAVVAPLWSIDDGVASASGRALLHQGIRRRCCCRDRACRAGSVRHRRQPELVDTRCVSVLRPSGDAPGVIGSVRREPLRRRHRRRRLGRVCAGSAAQREPRPLGVAARGRQRSRRFDGCIRRELTRCLDNGGAAEGHAANWSFDAR